MIQETTIQSILTRTTGFLTSVASHSLQPYRGCTFGKSLCGVGCYVQHAQHILQGREWGSFLEVRTNAAEAYRENFSREARWAREHREKFAIFCSSATDPFVPQEFRYGITRSILETMCEIPPDELIVQTHSHRVAEYASLLKELAGCCALRVHVSLESDRDRLPGLPPPASTVAQRMHACSELKATGLMTVVTVSPLLPIKQPDTFFQRIAEVADAVVLDHFIEGDGSRNGQRTLRTSLPAAIAAIDPRALELAYRDEMVQVAQRYLPGRVGVNIDGFAGRWLPG